MPMPEEPFFDAESDRIDVLDAGNNVFRLIPHLTEGGEAANKRIKPLLDDKLSELGIQHHINWFYTPMMLELADGMEPQATIYDAMDELSAFRGAPPELLANGRLEQLLASLAGSSGFVIIDAGSVLSNGGAAVLARYAGQIAFVVAANTTSRSEINQGLATLDRIAGPIDEKSLGLIFN